MSRDRDRYPRDRREDDNQETRNRREAPASIDEETPTEESPSETELLVGVVDTVVTPQASTSEVTELKEPGLTRTNVTVSEFRIPTVTHSEVTQQSDKIDTVIAPEHHRDTDTAATENATTAPITIPIIDSIQAQQTTTTAINSIHPTAAINQTATVDVTITQNPTVHQTTEDVSTMVTPSQALTQQRNSEDILEVDEADPVFQWQGGTPYGSDRPKFIIHVDANDFPALELLQRFLRDTYKEIEGGEPRGESVEFVANEPRIPTVENSIVTFDLTTGDWQPSLRGDEPVIEGPSGDLVPTLQTVGQELYTGDLGYFVLNVPSDWDHSVRRPEFHQKLVDWLATQTNTSGESEASLFESVRASPIVLAQTFVEEESVFFQHVADYFGLASTGSATRIGQVETAQERILKQNDWLRVALTSQHKTDRERASDEHYFWKAAMVEGFAWWMWNADTALDEFAEFVQHRLLGTDVIQTEPTESTESAVPDIYINNQGLASDGISKFIAPETEETVTNDVAIEFETGRTEGAFNFRKLRDTVAKYDAGRDLTVCVVVPPRLLFRGRKRSQMIRQLVETWNESVQLTARSYTPRLEDGRCKHLIPTNRLHKRLYPEVNDE